MIGSLLRLVLLALFGMVIGWGAGFRINPEIIRNYLPDFFLSQSPFRKLDLVGGGSVIGELVEETGDFIHLKISGETIAFLKPDIASIHIPTSEEIGAYPISNGPRAAGKSSLIIYDPQKNIFKLGRHIGLWGQMKLLQKIQRQAPAQMNRPANPRRRFP